MTGDVLKLLRDKAVVSGSRQTLKELKLGKVKQVIVAKSCPLPVRREIEYYAKMAKVPVLEFAGTSWELGLTCKKPFKVAALAILKTKSRKK